MFVTVGAIVSIVVVFETEPVPAVEEALTTPVALTVAITVPSAADGFDSLKRYGPAPEPLTRVLVQVPVPPLVPLSVMSSMPKPVTAWVKDTE